MAQIDTRLTAVRRGKAALPANEACRLRADLASLNPREREILERRFGLGGTEPQSLRQVGERLGISGERVRQLEHRALAEIGATDLTTAVGSARAAKGVTQTGISLPRESLEAWTLLLLRGHPAHGYELNKRLHERGFHHPGPRVYRLLAELERTGVVRSEWAPSGEGGPERRIYRLTRKGLRELHEAAETLHRRCETLRLFLSHYAQASDGPGRDKRLRPAPPGEALLSA